MLLLLRTASTLMLKWLLVCTVLLLSRSLELNLEERHELKILNPPRSGQAIGGATHFSALITSRFGDMPTNNKIPFEYRVSLAVNGRIVYTAPAANRLFECVLVDPTFQSGWNNLTIVLYQQGHLLAVDYVLVQMVPPNDTNVQLVTSAMVLPSVLVAGVGKDALVPLARLDSYILTVLDVHQEPCMTLGSQKITRCIRSVEELHRALYFDAAVVSWSGVRSASITSIDGTGVRGEQALLQRILAMTHGTVWVWVPDEDIEHVRTQWESLHIHAKCVTESAPPPVSPGSKLGVGADFGGGKEQAMEVMGHTLFTIHCTCRGTGNIGFESNQHKSEAHQNEPEQRDNTPIGLHSRVVAKDWRLGRVRIHLENACLLPDGRGIVVFTNTSSDQSATHPSSVWGELWDRAASDEDFGFQYTPLLLRPVSVLGTGASAARYLHEHARWHDGITALPFSAQAGHIVHQIEALLQLLESDIDANCEPLGPVPLPQITRLLFPLLAVGQANDWVLSVIALILQYRDAERAQRCGSHNTSPTLVYLRQHLFPDGGYVEGNAFYVLKARRTAGQVFERDLPEEELQGAQCFRNLVLLGRTNTHVKFFPTPALADLFRSFVYTQVQASTFPEQLQSDQDIATMGTGDFEADAEEEPPLRCSPSSTHCTMHVFKEAPSPTSVQALLSGAVQSNAQPRHRRLKITISIRTNGRYILNLPELLQSMLGTGLVSRSWLLAHVLVLETLSFDRQVQIMAQTDVLICVHGAAVINGIFMRPGSVVLELFNARFVEFVFAAPLREAGVLLLYTFPRDHANDTTLCPPHIPAQCLLPETGAYEVGSVDCVAIRTCSVRVHVQDFQVAFMQAYYHVLSAKWHGTAAFSTDAPSTGPGVDDEKIMQRIVAARNSYVVLSRQRQYAAALEVALTMQGITAWKEHPVYLMEVGVLLFSTGEYQQSFEICQRARDRADSTRIGGATLRVQVNVCIGVAGAQMVQEDVGDVVLEALQRAWEALREAHQGDGTESVGNDLGIRSTLLMAAPRDSIEYNLLRAYDRYGRPGECIEWYTQEHGLPGLHTGGAYVVAFSAVNWSDSRAAQLGRLEATLRSTGRLQLSANTSLWDEVKRLQDTAAHSISLANLCLNKLPTCSPGSTEERRHCMEAGMREAVWEQMYTIATSRAEPFTEIFPTQKSAPSNQSCGVALITQYYEHEDAAKAVGIAAALQRNLDNAHISEVYLLNERQTDLTAMNNTDKVYQFVTGKRLTFRDAFLFANRYLSNRIVVLANSDIFFDDTLERLSSCPLPHQPSVAPSLPPLTNKVLALLKWQADAVDPAAAPHLTIRVDSQDAWVFRAPLKQSVLDATEFFLGQPKCDNRLVSVLLRAGYVVRNPAFAVRAIEYPYDLAVPVYDAVSAVTGEVTDLLLSDDTEF